MHVAEVHTLYESNRLDVAATLRAIANDIENGVHGDVGSVALVVFGDTMEVFGMGRDSEAPTIGMLLHAGFMRISRALEEHGRDV